MDTLEAELVHYLINDLLSGYRAEVSGGSWLPNHEITANKGNGSIPASDCNREVEGSDASDKAKWVPLFHHKVTRSLTWEHLTFQGS